MAQDTRLKKLQQFRHAIEFRRFEVDNKFKRKVGSLQVIEVPRYLMWVSAFLPISTTNERE